MAFEIGTTLGGYEFLDFVDSSKTGIIYKVRNVKFGRVEMLRILPLNLQGDKEKVDRFLREVKVHARLSHPNIITFYNATEIEGQLVMTMELVEGIPLASRLEGGPIPYLEAVDYARQILSALSYAHKQATVHRDVTPANILVTPDKRAMLGGFGMAKAATDPNLTQTGTAIGVAEYMSPEQVKGVAALNGQSDLYSLGVVLYQAITGSVPFHASSQYEIMVAHVNTAPKSPSLINPDLPESLVQIVLTALAKDTTKRFQTAKEFSEALAEVERAGKDKPSAAKVAAPVMATAAPAEAAGRAAHLSPPRVPAAPAWEYQPASAASAAAARGSQAAKTAVAPVSASAGKSAEAPSKRPWTLGELVLGGVLASVVFTILFLALLTMTGVLHV